MRPRMCGILNMTWPKSCLIFRGCISSRDIRLWLRPVPRLRNGISGRRRTSNSRRSFPVRTGGPSFLPDPYLCTAAGSSLWTLPPYAGKKAPGGWTSGYLPPVRPDLCMTHISLRPWTATFRDVLLTIPILRYGSWTAVWSMSRTTGAM